MRARGGCGHESRRTRGVGARERRRRRRRRRATVLTLARSGRRPCPTTSSHRRVRFSEDDASGVRRVRRRRRADILRGGRREIMHAMRSNGARRRRDDDATATRRGDRGTRRCAREGTFSNDARAAFVRTRARRSSASVERWYFDPPLSRARRRGDATARAEGRRTGTSRPARGRRGNSH